MAMFGNRRQSTLGDMLTAAVEAHAQSARQAAQRPAPRAVARTYHPPVSERIGNALAPLIGREGGHSLGNLLRDWTPIGNIEGVAADPSLRSPNALLSALPIPGPARRVVKKGVGTAFPSNDDPGLNDTVRSLTGVLGDPRPTHQLYQPGDMLTLGDEIGEVVSASDGGLVINFPSGRRVVPRNQRGLEVAPLEHWRR